ncbi:TonB-linked SusC/RagA family outer membrane protein [Dysgonomonas alginatilytica]|uniref:TonB-linked SusC/RagA family outer membrane protein n=1 Tax=Dysgonomonas alginatilytica TaxID=1605892 RepID=A0A2V3PRM6_9BACT|nr:TonB-dependent receptor [Dysgonomonas alginatilytica]PXV65035.1 TonB-linked SusC/RagA family outer membrane protein [Dysgonomonas alginatilytica]
MKKKKEFLGKRYWYLLLAGLCLSSFTAHAKQNISISLNKPQTTVRDVLNEIEKKTDYSFVYNDRLVDANKIVSVKATDKPVSDILDEVFEDSNISYTIVDNQIVLSAGTKEVQQDQKRIVKGTLKDSEGAELPGVSVIVKGKTTGTVSDLDGNFSIEVPENATLIFSYIGYLPQEVKVGGKSDINVVLREDNKSLDEVIVVGYTTQKKADLTGAVSSVKMSNLEDMANVDISSALQGRMSGVTVLQGSGAPGSGTSVRIRGMGTFGNNDPLYVIDGMPADNMNDLNPSDIERIDVLKDAASAAIYGSRAANGVVIISTKKGSKSDKVNVTFNTFQGFSAPQHKIDVLNAQQRNMIHLEAYANDFNSIANPTQDQINAYNKNIAYYSTPFAQETRTNWQDEVFTNSAYQGNYDLSVAGGSDKIKYNIMGGHLTQDGILKGTSFKRTTFRVNTETDITKKLKFGENLMITHSKQNIVPDMSASSGAIISALRADPSVPVYDENANLSGSGPLGADIQNPVGIIQRADRVRTRDRIFGNVYAQYSIIDNLVLKTDFGYDWSKWQDKWFTARVPEAGRASNSNELTQRDWQSTRWINTTTLKYDKTIDKHKFMILGGYAYEEFDVNYTNARGTGFISEEPSQRYLSAATNIAWMQGEREQWALQSYFARLDYSFADRYLLSLNFRADGSSKFAKNNRWGYFPSVSGGWRISEEQFFEPLKASAIQNLKVRASWGKLGNQDINDFYPTKVAIQNTTDDDGYNVVFGQNETATIGRYEASMANPNIKWEVTTQTNLGLDVTFLNHFDFTFDYYNKNTTDVLIQVPVPSLAGVTSNPWLNAAEVQNKGIDLNLSYNTKINDLQINTYGNFSTVKNKVRSMGTGNSALFTSAYRGTNISRTFAGQPIAHFYGYKTAGIFRSEDEIKNYKNSTGALYQPNAKPGDIKFVDVNGDDQIDGNDRTNIGSGFPKFTYGLGTDLAYKGFDLSLFFQGVAGYSIFNALKYEGMFVNARYNQYTEIMDRFHEVNNPNGSLARVTLEDKNSNKRMSDYYVDKGDYLRLKVLTLGYTLNKETTRKIGIQNVRLYVTVQNLFTITGYKGYDPDLGNAYVNEIEPNGPSEVGVDRGQFPQTKSFIMGLNINF